MDAAKLRNGTKILMDSQPYNVLSYTLRPQSRGAAKMITKLRNLLTGAVIEKTFASTETMHEADISRSRAQYLYNDGSNYVFMDNDTYEQFEFTGEKLGKEITNFMKDDMEVLIMKFNDNPINVELPPTVILEVVHTEPGVRGDTATGGTKPAELETGVMVTVPLFINIGEKLVINTQTGDYKERAK